MRKLNKKEMIQKEMEKHYARIYANRVLRIEPNFIETSIHPDCMFMCHDDLYAVEATGYFYQQETDYSNRLYKKVLRFIKSNTFLQDIYKTLGRKPLLNIVDAIYYDREIDLINDLLSAYSVIDEIKISNNYFYSNEHLLYNAYVNNKLVKMDLKDYLELIKGEVEYRVEVTLKKGYLIPIKVILMHNDNIIYNQRRTLIPIVSFCENNTYNFKSLKSLIENKEQKLISIYKEELKKQNILYKKFILLIHPIDYPIDIYPELIYNELKKVFKKSNYDSIAIILKDNIMVVNKNYYRLY